MLSDWMVIECSPVKILLSEIFDEDDALTGACGPEFDTGGRMERRLLLVEVDMMPLELLQAPAVIIDLVEDVACCYGRRRAVLIKS